MDITQLILDDHAEQRRLFALIEQVDPADQPSLAKLWQRLATVLEVHAETEERIFYPALLRSGRAQSDGPTVEAETLDAIKDHNEIRDAVAAVAGKVAGSAQWYAAIAAANKANGDHMAEEEREGLTEFRRLALLDQRHALGVAFITFESAHVSGVEPVDKDPAQYVRREG